MLDTALTYHDAGLKVVPVYRNGDSVNFPQWNNYLETQSRQEVQRLFSSDHWGTAILCTDGLEVIDIDVKADPTGKVWEQYKDEVFWSTGIDILEECCIVKTKSNGYHIIYRTDSPEGNRKLAWRKGSKEAIIETRGKGGLVFAAPTPLYEVLQGSYTSIPYLDQDKRDALILAAQNLSERTPAEAPEEVRQHYRAEKEQEITPWDAYNETNNVLDILERHGWQRAGENADFIYLSKPGATNPRDTHGSVIKNKNIFHPFTTATEFEAERNYNPYALVTVLEYHGDFRASTRSIAKQGYGTTRKAVEDKQEDSFLAKVLATKFDIHRPVKQLAANYYLHHPDNGREYRIGGPGMIVGVVGAQKSSKSTITSSSIAAALSNNHPLGFEIRAKGGKIVYYDTEQSEYFYDATQRRLYAQAGLVDNPSLYDVYLLREFSVADRIRAIEMTLPKKAEIVVIDGIKDICSDFMDSKAAQETMELLMQWSFRTGAMIIPVLHTTKSSGFVRGHLGTELQNKADALIETIRDGEEQRFTVKCRESRFAPFPPFTFVKDENGFPIIET